MELTDRERAVVTRTWGDEMPADLREVDADQLWAMHERVTKTVQASYRDNDVDSLGNPGAAGNKGGPNAL